MGHDREILRLAVPALGSLAADPLLSIVDAALIGHLGVAPLAALALAVVIFNLAFTVFNFLAYGTTGPVARLVASGKTRHAASYAAQAFWVALGLGVVVTVAAELLARPLGRLAGGRGEVLDLFLVYFRIRILALTPLLVTMVGHGLFRGLQDTRTPLLITVGVNAVNATLAYVLIYPVGLGVAGAAIATLSAQSVGAAIFFWRGARRVRPWAGDGAWRPHWAPMRGLLQLSRSLLLRTASLYGVFFLSTSVAARMGTATVAAHQVAIELWMFLAMLLDSIAIAGQALTGRYLGMGDAARAEQVGRRMLVWGVGMGVVFGAAFWAGRALLPRIFTTDPAVLAGVAGIFVFVAAFQPLNGFVFVLDGILIGASDAAYLARSMVLSALCAVPMALLSLRYGWGLTGIWLGLSTLMVVRALTVGLRFYSGRWTRAAAR